MRAVSLATGLPYADVCGRFAEMFGSVSVGGRQMRRFMTGLGWSWVRTSELPGEGRLVVVARRGFYAQLDGAAHDAAGKGRICGYYHK